MRVGLTNSKFIPAGKDKPIDSIMLEVSDDSMGMDAETVKQAYEPLLHHLVRRRGTGLGLA